MNKHVLVIADIEDDDFLSLEKARDVAIDISASIEVVKFTHYDSESDGPVDQYLTRVEQMLDATIQRVFDEQLEVTRKIVLREGIDDWMVERCHSNRDPIDLVIKGSHRTESLFHTPTDWKLIRHLHCPILIANHTKWKSMANILMTLDLAHSDQKHKQLNELTINWANLWSNATNTELHAVYSIPIAKPLLELEIVDRREVESKKAPAAEVKMHVFLDKFDMHSVTCHTPAGPPEKTIPHLANELHSDLVIMGCLGREGVSGFFLGNTAEKVLHNIRTDCLIIKLPED